MSEIARVEFLMRKRAFELALRQMASIPISFRRSAMLASVVSAFAEAAARRAADEVGEVADKLIRNCCSSTDDYENACIVTKDDAARELKEAVAEVHRRLDQWVVEA